MISKIFFSAVVILYYFTAFANAEDCVPQSVADLTISANATLSWGPDPNEECEITGYRVDIVGDRDDEYHFSVLFPFVHVSFLEICEEWHFVVTAISNGVYGFERRLVEHIPLPPSADLSLQYLNVTEITSRDVLVQWDLNNRTYGDCTLRYRITVQDEGTSDIQDIYVTGNSVHLHLLSPCVDYAIGIRAVNRAHPTIEGPARYNFLSIPPEPEEVPRLTAVDVGATTANMTWRLENPGRNRCPIKTLFVDGGIHFNISIPLEDTPQRPPVTVNLRGLTPDSMYFIRVSVENTGGISQTASVGIQTLELAPGSN